MYYYISFLQVERARERGRLCQAFHQWQLQSLRSKLHSVTLALAASAAAPNATSATNAQEQFPPAANMELALRQVPAHAAEAPCPPVFDEQLGSEQGSNQAPLTDAQAAAEVTGSAAQAAGIAREVSEALVGATPMDISGADQSDSAPLQAWGGDGGAVSGQASRPWAAEAAGDLALERGACKPATGANSPMASRVPPQHAAATNAGSFVDVLHPDDDGLLEWVSSSCCSNAPIGIGSCAMEITESEEQHMQATAAASCNAPQQEPPAAQCHSPAAARKPDSFASRIGPMLLPEPTSFGQQWAAARGLDSPGSPGGCGRLMAAHQEALAEGYTEGVASCSRPADPPTAFTSAASIKGAASTASACLLQPADDLDLSAAASDISLQSPVGSAAADAWPVDSNIWDEEPQGKHTPELQQPRDCQTRAAAAALLGSPGAPSTQIAPMVCAAFGPGSGGFVHADALASPITPAKEGAPRDGRPAATAPIERRRLGGARLSQSSGWSSEQGSCSGDESADDSSRERLRKRLFRSVDCRSIMACPPSDCMAAPAVTCQVPVTGHRLPSPRRMRQEGADALALQGFWSVGPGGPLQQGRMGVGPWDIESAAGGAAAQLMPAPLEAGRLGASRVRSLMASFETAASSNKTQHMSGVILSFCRLA